MARRNDDLTLIVGFDIDKFIAELNKTNKALGRFASTATSTLKTLQSQIVGTFGAYQIYRGLEHGVKTMAAFEKQMDTVAAITGASSGELKQLTDNAINLAGAFNSIDIARMETELARLGLSTKEIIASTEAIVNLATATGEDLAKSADTVGSVLRIYNITAAESGKVTDIMAGAFNTSALALDNFTEAIKYVGPVAHNAGLSLEQTSAMLGVLADSGIRGSMAGTSLRKIISDLGKGAAPELTRRLREMAAAGITGADAMDEVGRTAYASLLILANNTPKIDAQTKALEKTEGAAAATAKIMGDNLATDANKAAAAWDAMFISGSKLLPVFRSVVQGWTKFVTGVSGTRSPAQQFQIALETLNWQIEHNREITENNLNDLEVKAKAAGERIFLVWDKTGKRIASVYHISQSGQMGPNQPGAAGTDPLSGLIGPRRKQDPQQYFPKDLDYQMAVNRMAWDEERKFQENLKKLNDQSSKDFDEWYKNWNDSQYQASLDSLALAQDVYEKKAALRQKEIEDMKSMASVAIAVGEAIGDALVSSIQDGEKFGMALLRQVDQAVRQLYRLAVAYMIQKAIQNSGPFPLAGIAIATAGMLGIRALFAGIQGNQAAKAEGMTMNDYRASKRNDGGNVNFIIQGQNLVGVIDNYNRIKQRTG